MQSLAEHYRIHANQGDITDRTRKFCELMIKICEQGAFNDEESQVIADTIHEHQEARKSDLEDCKEKLKEFEAAARFADYAMVNCKALMNVEANFVFQDYLWHKVVEMLDK